MTAKNGDNSTNGEVGRRLTSWKEIAAFFGKDERTVKRWETQRGLPIHRLPGGSRTTVFAYAEELEQWLRGASGKSADALQQAAPGDPVPGRGNSDIGRWLFPGVAAVAVVLALTAWGPFERSRTMTPEAALTSAASAATAGTQSQEAADLYLSGVYYWNKRTPEDLNRAVHHFNQAIAIDPEYAEAYVGLANSYNLLREYTLMPASEAYPRAKAAAERAIALNDSLAEAHTALAFVDFYWSRNFEAATRAFDRSLALDPNSVRAHHWYATALLHLGDYQKSLQEITRAQQLDPTSRSILADKGLILFYAGREEEAIALLTGMEKAEADYLSPHAYLASIYFAQGRYGDYLRKARDSARLRGDDARLAVLDAAQAGFDRSGPEGMFAALLDVQQQAFARGEEQAYSLARTYALLGDREKALQFLGDSIQRREQNILEIKVDRAFASLHQVPEYRALVAEVGLPLDD